MISHKHQCIYIHIPKTAGTSVEQKLGLFDHPSWGAQDHSTISEIQPISFFKHAKFLSKRHLGISRKRLLFDLLKLNQGTTRRLSVAQYQSYFKFSIVRNPWDRVYSWYRNVIRDKRFQIPECDFQTFLYRYKDSFALRPQLFWIKDFSGTIPLNGIMKFERLSEDMPIVLDRLGFTDLTLPHLLNIRKEIDDPYSYRRAYNEITSAIIKERSKEEIELFGYHFSE
jgi:hypothetical protein